MQPNLSEIQFPQHAAEGTAGGNEQNMKRGRDGKDVARHINMAERRHKLKRGRDDSNIASRWDPQVLWELFPPQDIPQQYPDSVSHLMASSMPPTTTWNFHSSDAGLRNTHALFPDPKMTPNRKTLGMTELMSFNQLVQNPCPEATPSENESMQTIQDQQALEFRRNDSLVKNISESMRPADMFAGSGVSPGVSPIITTSLPTKIEPMSTGVQDPVPHRKKKIVRERLRRAGLSQRFEQLHGLVLAAERKNEIRIVHDAQPKNKGKLSKATVLEATIDVVKALTRKVTDLITRNAQLHSELSCLQNDAQPILLPGGPEAQATTPSVVGSQISTLRS